MKQTETTDYRPMEQQSVDAVDEAIENMDALGDNLEALLEKNRRPTDA